MSETSEQLRKLFERVLTREIPEFGPATVPLDLPQWDSLRHISLVLAIEEEFGLQFTSAEFGRLYRVGEILDIVENRGNGRL